MKVEFSVKEQFPYEKLEGKDVIGEISKVQKLMESTNLKWWFSAGTVLGIIREERGYILHDKDIDLEVIEGEGVRESIIELMKTNSYRPIRFMEVGGKNCQLAFINDNNNIIIDYYLYTLKGEEYINYNDVGILTIPKEMIDNRDYNDKKGREFMMPQPSNEYLIHRYGDWETPRNNKVSWIHDAGVAFKKW